MIYLNWIIILFCGNSFGTNLLDMRAGRSSLDMFNILSSCSKWLKKTITYYNRILYTSSMHKKEDGLFFYYCILCVLFYMVSRTLRTVSVMLVDLTMFVIQVQQFISH